MAGQIYHGQQRVDKAGSKVDRETKLEVHGKLMPYVGRGGLKLEKALSCFPVSVKGKRMLDIGASTGGFTDCALQNGACQVYALDVGYNQLAWKLRSDHRVIVMERTNFRYCTPANFTEGLPEFATIDVSFISLKKILPALKDILLPQGDVIALIKPQFEAGREEVGKKGIVRDSRIHQKVIEDILQFAEGCGFMAYGLDFSPITGGDGNIEFLAWLRLADPAESSELNIPSAQEVVAKAHQTFTRHSAPEK